MSFDILICGDFYVGEHAGGRLVPLLEKANFELLFGDLLSELKDSKLSVVNLEAPITKPYNKSLKTGPSLSMDDKVLDALEYAGIDLVTLANNHIMDYGVDGLENTLNKLNNKNISFVGAGRNINEIQKPFISEIKQKKIAIINVCENEWITNELGDVGANGLDLIEIYYQISQLNQENDFVFVIYHGGNEYYPLPTPEIKKIFRFFIDAGACAVIGHHTHTFSGYEIYKDKPIFYSLGNFIFDSNKNSKGVNWHTGLCAGFSINDSKLEYKLFPFTQNLLDVGVKKLNETQKIEFNKKILKFNQIIASDQFLNEEFNKFIKKMSIQYDAFISPYEGKLNAMYKKGVLPSLFTKKKYSLLLNLIRCQSHKTVLENVLRSKLKN